MRAIVRAQDDAQPRLVQMARPERAAGEVLVRTLLTGLDGTDQEVLQGDHGEPPEGEAWLVMGHECLGEVVEASDDSPFSPGDRVIPSVRHGCMICQPCLNDTSDHCETGLFTEHGIKQRHGFLRDEWTDEASCLLKAPKTLGDLAVLTEPLSIIVKALDQAGRFQERLPQFVEGEGFRGQRALLAGTGSLGTLAAFLLRELDMEVWAMDRSDDDTFGARLLRDIGARHINAHEHDIRDTAREIGGFDLVIEATGAPKVVFDVALTLRENGIMCMLGVPPEKEPFPIHGDDLMRQMVLGNQILFGSVNSNRTHYETALDHLARFRQRWNNKPDTIITHTYSPDQAPQAFQSFQEPDHVKTTIDWR